MLKIQPTKINPFWDGEDVNILHYCLKYTNTPMLHAQININSPLICLVFIFQDTIEHSET